jgi:hypothetical protein
VNFTVWDYNQPGNVPADLAAYAVRHFQEVLADAECQGHHREDFILVGRPIVVEYTDRCRYVRVTYRDRVVFEIAYVDDAEFLHCRAEHGLESDEDRYVRDWVDSIYLDEHPSQFIASLRGYCEGGSTVAGAND